MISISNYGILWLIIFLLGYPQMHTLILIQEDVVCVGKLTKYISVRELL